MKENRREKTRRTFLQWYQEEQPSLKKGLSMNLRAVIGIPLFIVVAFIVCLHHIGSGAYSYSESIYTQLATSIQNNVVQDIGMDAMMLQAEVDKYVSTYENGITTLTCSKRNGYFEAKVTAQFSEQYEVLSTKKNYESREQYMREYWIIFGALTIGGGTLAWLLVNCLCYGLLASVAFVMTKISEMKEHKVVSTEVS